METMKTAKAPSPKGRGMKPGGKPGRGDARHGAMPAMGRGKKKRGNGC